MRKESREKEKVLEKMLRSSNFEYYFILCLKLKKYWLYIIVMELSDCKRMNYF